LQNSVEEDGNNCDAEFDSDDEAEVILYYFSFQMKGVSENYRSNLSVCMTCMYITVPVVRADGNCRGKNIRKHQKAIIGLQKPHCTKEDLPKW